MSLIQKLRLLLVGILIIDLVVIGYLAVSMVKNNVPDQLLTFVGEEDDISLPMFCETVEAQETLCVTNKSSGFSLSPEKKGEYNVSVKLLGVIPVKNVNVKVIEKMKLAPSGEPVGIYVETKGLLVLDTAEIEGEDGMTYAPAGGILQSGDYILRWAGNKVTTIEELNQEIQRSGKKKTKVQIRRNEEVMEVAVKPIVATDGNYKIGAWVREDTQGVGTLTYVTEQGEFGTLGHGITDIDTGTLYNLSGGELYYTQILGITKGTEGVPGELQGYIQMNNEKRVGTIKKNTALGVFGKMASDKQAEYARDFIPVGMKQEIKRGEAEIQVALQGELKRYKIKIEEININSQDNKSMVIKITDKQLLKLTGGIVQGMSGSPIIQDGKIVGAVTHVLVDDPTRGYGVFIENMLQY